MSWLRMSRFFWLIGVISVVSLTSLWWPNRSAEKNLSDSDSLALCQQNLKALSDSLEAYRCNSIGGYPPATVQALLPSWRTTVPKCPTTNTEYRFERYFDPAFDALSYVVTCPGHHRGLKPGFPRWDGTYGLEMTEPTQERKREAVPLDVAPTFTPCPGGHIPEKPAP